MPIDLNLFRSPEEGGNIAAIQKWQEKRIRKSSTVDTDDVDTMAIFSSITNFLSIVRKADAQRKDLLRELNSKRHELKSLQKELHVEIMRGKKKLKQNNDDDTDRKSVEVDTVIDKNLRKEISLLEKEIIPKLVEEYDHMSHLVDNVLLPMVGNQVDETDFPVSLHYDEGVVVNIDTTKKEDSTIQHQKLQSEEDENKKIQKDNKPNKKQKKKKSGGEIEIIDPLFCIGGCEKISSENMLFSHNTTKSSTSSSFTTVIMSGLGFTLLETLKCHAMSHINNNAYHKNKQNDSDNIICPLIQWMNIPSSCFVNKNMALSIMGSSKDKMLSKSNSLDLTSLSASFDKINIDDFLTTKDENNNDDSSSSSQNSIPLPNYAILSLLHQNKAYSQQNNHEILVQIAACCSNSSTQSSLKDGKGTFLRKNSCLSSLFQSPTTNSSILNEKIDLFTLCESDLDTSRQIQNDMALSILKFYESLLVCVENDSQKNDNDNKGIQPFLRIRCIPVSELELNETRRVVIEGLVPPSSSAPHSILLNDEDDCNNSTATIFMDMDFSDTNTKANSTNDKYIELGHVSNYTDYISRACNTRYGIHNKYRGRKQNQQGKRRVAITPMIVEYAYTLHGTFCDFAKALEWVMEINTFRVKKCSNANDNNNNNKGLFLPYDLIRSYPHLWNQYEHNTVFWDPRKLLQSRTQPSSWLQPTTDNEVIMRKTKVKPFFVLPFILQQVKKSNNGKIIVSKVKGIHPSHLVSLKTLKMRQNHRKANNDTNLSSIEASSYKSEKSSPFLMGKFGKGNSSLPSKSSCETDGDDDYEDDESATCPPPTKQQIHLESICTPYSFLPFYK